MGRLALKKPLFNWNAQDRYVKLLDFEMVVTNILKTKAYELPDEEKLPVIKTWLSQKDLQLIKMLTNDEKG